jgi:hypothetical protein
MLVFSKCGGRGFPRAVGSAGALCMSLPIQLSTVGSIYQKGNKLKCVFEDADSWDDDVLTYDVSSSYD